VLKPEPRSLRISGTVGEWEEWTGMTFPDSGEYWFPGGLATVKIDRESNDLFLRSNHRQQRVDLQARVRGP
jgi:hypothetical protein